MPKAKIIKVSKANESIEPEAKPDYVDPVLARHLADSDPYLSELYAAYADTRDLIEVWRVIRMDVQMTAKRNRLLAALDAVVKER